RLSGRATNASTAFVAGGERLKQTLSDFEILLAHSGNCFVGIARERIFDRADGFVMTQVQLRISATLPLFPCSHQRVLKDRQLVGLVPNVVEQAVQQSLAQLRAEQPDRPLDGLPSLLPCGTGDKVLATVHGFGETVKVIAISKEVRAHGHNYVDR